MGTAALVGLSAVGTFAAYRGNKQDEKIQRKIASYNAELSKRNAELALESSDKRAEDARERTQQIISSHRAALGASGLVTTSGSPMLAQLKQAELGEETAQDILLEGRMQAAGFSAQESLDRFTGEAARARGRSQRAQMLLSGISSGIGTAATLRSK
jgi:hypothetical protein